MILPGIVYQVDLDTEQFDVDFMTNKVTLNASVTDKVVISDEAKSRGYYIELDYDTSANKPIINIKKRT